MLTEIKRCAESNDIKGLRYIFLDSLDVDPTFEKYRSDYETCKKIPGMFDLYLELSTLTDDRSVWTIEYWNQLKLDLQKNFAEKRFNHMISVAMVVYADKIARLKSERVSTLPQKSGSDLGAEAPKTVASTPAVDNVPLKLSEVKPKEIKTAEVKLTSTKNSQTTEKTAEEEMEIQRRMFAEKARALEADNKRIEAEQQAQRKRIEDAKKAEPEKLRRQQEEAQSKKGLGIVIAIIAVVVIIVLVLVKDH